jgi:hypothetical protein
MSLFSKNLLRIFGKAIKKDLNFVNLSFQGVASHTADSNDVFADLIGNTSNQSTLEGNFVYNKLIPPCNQEVKNNEVAGTGYSAYFKNNILGFNFTLNKIEFSINNIISSKMEMVSFGIDFRKSYSVSVNGLLTASGRQQPAEVFFLLRNTVSGASGWTTPITSPPIPTDISGFNWREFQAVSSPAKRIFFGKIDNIVQL